MLDATQTLENPRLGIGGNFPPPDPEPTPYDRAKLAIEDIRGEALHWLDGASIEDQAQADAVSKIITDMRAAAIEAETLRVAEKAPWDAGAKEVQEKFNPLLADPKAGKKGIAPLVISTCKIALDGFLERERQRLAVAADEARRKAEEIRQAAQEAIRASEPTNLAEREAAEDLIRQSRDAEKIARKAESARPAARGGGRAITSRERSVAVLTDPQACLRHAREVWADDLKDWLRERAQQDVNAGRRGIPGITVEIRHTVV